MKKTLFCYFDYKKSSYTPLDLAYVKSFVIRGAPSLNADIIPVKAELSEADAGREAQRLASLRPDTIVFFLDSILWSMVFSLAAAAQITKKIKGLLPQTRVLIQSYKIRPALRDRIFRDFPEVDFIFHGEPEIPLRAYFSGVPASEIPGVSYREKGHVRTNPEAALIEDPDELPSPYLSGVLEEFVRAKTVKRFFMSTSRGCPFRCHYCFRSVKFSKVRNFSIGRVMDEIEYLADRGAPHIFMLDDCFIVSKKRFLAMAEAYQERFSGRQDMPRITIMSRPEFLDEAVVRRFPDMKIRSIQLGLQTVNPDAQFLMGRLVTVEYFQQVVKWLKDAGVSILLDVIIGLPHDDLAHCRKTLDLADSMEPDFLQVKQLYQNPDTLFDLYPERYGIETESAFHPYHAPFVKKTNTFSNEDMQAASKYANKIRLALPSGRRMRLLTQFHWFSG